MDFLSETEDDNIFNPSTDQVAMSPPPDAVICFLRYSQRRSTVEDDENTLKGLCNTLFDYWKVHSSDFSGPYLHIGAVQPATYPLKPKYARQVTDFILSSLPRTIDLVISGADGFLVSEIALRDFFDCFRGVTWRLSIYFPKTQAFHRFDISALLAYWTDQSRQASERSDQHSLEIVQYAEFLNRATERRKDQSDSGKRFQVVSGRSRNSLVEQPQNVLTLLRVCFTLHFLVC